MQIVGSASLIDLMEHPPFFNCGIIPEDERILTSERGVERAFEREEDPFNSSDYRQIEWWQQGYRMVYGDGSVESPKDRFCKARSGVYFGPSHPANMGRPNQGRGKIHTVQNYTP